MKCNVISLFPLCFYFCWLSLECVRVCLSLCAYVLFTFYWCVCLYEVNNGTYGKSIMLFFIAF